VVLVSQVAGFAIAVAIAVVAGQPMPMGMDAGLSVLAGVLGAIGITALYHGLAVGRMGVVAPVTGVLAAVIPVVVGIAIEGLPPGIVMIGIVCAIVAVVLVSRVVDEAGGRSGLPEGLLAGACIGGFGIVISQISDGMVFSSLSVIRATEAAILVILILGARSAWRPPRTALPAILLIGILDMSGNALYLAALQTGALAVAAVLSSLYPVGTLFLAALVLGERITRDHAAGIALAVGAIVLIGVGSA
jgi:drug/metabolite transporter (DMT)-like permease